jgi:hypothetical protein
MSICFQTVPCDYSPAVFARNLTERRFGSLLYVYNGVFDLKRQALVSSDAWKAAQQPELCDQSAFVFWSSLVLQRFGFR